MKNTIAILSACAASLLACGIAADTQSTAAASPKAEAPAAKPAPKLTKEMFYKDGKFDQEAAKKAYINMMERLGYPISDNMRENMWVADFGLGDFPAVGMGGIFWATEDAHGVFGHEILLLPNQMLIEHYHVAVPDKKLPAKNECWHARAGVSYCFGEEGEDASKYPSVKIPDSQKDAVTVGKISVADAKKGNIVWLNRIGARHFQIAGPEGAVVTEYGTFHCGDGVKFTNKNSKF